MTVSITDEQYAVAQSYAASGDYVSGWSYLASVGDSYADNAYAVTSGNSEWIDKGFQILVEKHWGNTAGTNAYDEKFESVARQHFRQYVEKIGEQELRLPNSQEIEQSYRNAVVDHGLPPETAFDGVFTKSFGDLADNFWPDPKENGLDWTDFLRMEDARQVASNVFDDLDSWDSWKTLIKDVWDTVAELVKFDIPWLVSDWSELLVSAKREFAEELMKGVLGDIYDVNIDVNGLFNISRAWFQRSDPLTLDLDGDGLETVGIDTANPILFDHDGDGVKNATGWIQPDDGFLVLDRNGDGVINDGTELFGDSTPVFDADGNVVRKAVDGFDALAQEDTNGDGLVNNQDANSDGISQANEHTALLDTSAVPLSVAQRIKCTKSCTTRNIRRPHGNFSQRRDSPFTGSRQLF